MENNQSGQPLIAHASFRQIFKYGGWQAQVSQLRAYLQLMEEWRYHHYVSDIITTSVKVGPGYFLASDPAALLRATRFLLTITRAFELRQHLIEPSYHGPANSWYRLTINRPKPEIQFIIDFTASFDEGALADVHQRVLRNGLSVEDGIAPELHEEYTNVFDHFLQATVAFMCIFRESILAFDYPYSIRF